MARSVVEGEVRGTGDDEVQRGRAGGARISSALFDAILEEGNF